MLCPTRDECDIHDMMSYPSDIIKPSKHGTEFSSILASVFDFSPLFSRTFSFDTCSIFVICLAKRFFPLSIHHTIGQTGSFLFSLGYKHLWEALHVGHFPMVRTRKTGIQPHGYEAGSLGWFFV